MIENLSKYIDQTVLKPFAQEKDIIKLCKEAVDNQFMSVCINPCHIALAKRLLEGSDVMVCTVIGFPLGANTSQTKAAEAAQAVELGADEVDMVINIGALKDGRTDVVLEDIQGVVKAAGDQTVKVIIETGYLTDEEKALATRLSCQAGAGFVKTCTGFNEGVATEDDVRLMKRNCTAGVKVKASAGIRDYPTAVRLIEAGADRLGTSAGLDIVADQKNKM